MSNETPICLPIGWEHGIGFYVSEVQQSSLAAKKGLCVSVSRRRSNTELAPLCHPSVCLSPIRALFFSVLLYSPSLSLSLLSLYLSVLFFSIISSSAALLFSFLLCVLFSLSSHFTYPIRLISPFFQCQSVSLSPLSPRSNYLEGTTNTFLLYMLKV